MPKANILSISSQKICSKYRKIRQTSSNSADKLKMPFMPNHTVFNKNKTIIFQNGKIIKYKTLKQSATYMIIQPGETLLFVQHLPHQGMGYKASNLRLFKYYDLVNVKSLKDGTTKCSLPEKFFIKYSELTPEFASSNKNDKFINLNK